MIPAVILAASAAAIWLGAPARSALRRLEPRRGAPAAWWRAGALLVVALAGSWAAGGPQLVGWLVAAGVALATIGWVWRAARQDRAARKARADTAQAARTLALLLRAGQIPSQALDQAAQDVPILAPAAATARVGADPAEAIAGLASRRGYEAMGSVAAAWRVCQASGAPIADVLGRVANQIRRARQVRGVVEAELSTARASGRIMAALPLVGVGLGVVVGADPVSFLFGTTLGQVLVIAAVCLTAVGVVWTEKLASSVGKRS
ncbi:MAG: type II secretion system F family protein [Arachnia sp.]